MEIRFKTTKLQKLCNSERQMTSQLGPEVAKKLRLRLQEVKAAETLEVLRRVSQARCHELVADRKGQLAVALHGGKRLIFMPDHDPLPTKPDGGLDWGEVTEVLVVEITDYHAH